MARAQIETLWQMVQRVGTRPLGVLLLMTCLATLGYANTFSASFHFDDDPNIVHNDRVHHLATFWESPGHRFNGSRDVGFWTFALNYYAGGRNVVGYHVVNLLIHITNGFLVYTLVGLFLHTPGIYGVHASQSPPRARWVALTTALLFLTHPIQTQAVTYIVQRFTSLATLFYLLAVVCYLHWRLSSPAHRRRYAWYAGALSATILAMKTKEISFTLPFLLLAVEGVCFQPVTWKRWRPLFPFLLTLPIIPLAYSGALGVAEMGWARETTEISRLSYLCTELRVVVTYLRLLVLPFHQSIDYDYPIYDSCLVLPVALSFLVLVSLAGLVLSLLVSSPRWRLVGLGGLWFFLTLSVESSIIPIKDVIFEHRLYLPSVGFLLAASAAGRELLPRWRGMAVGVVAFVVAVAVVATYQRNRVWQNELSLWTNAVERSPNKARSHNNLATAYAEQGRLEEAIKEYEAALKIRPDFQRVHNDLGAAYAKQGRLNEAVNEYVTAIALKPGDSSAHYNLGNAYFRQGRVEEAIHQYRIAVQLQPDLPDVHNNLGNAYAKQGRFSEAIQEYQRAVALQPTLPDVHYNLGVAYARQGQVDEAIKEYRATLTLAPTFLWAHYSLGRAYQLKGLKAEARQEFETVLGLNPEFAKARAALGEL